MPHNKKLNKNKMFRPDKKNLQKCHQSTNSWQLNSKSHTEYTESLRRNGGRELRVSSATCFRSFISLTLLDYKYLDLVIEIT